MVDNATCAELVPGKRVPYVESEKGTASSTALRQDTEAIVKSAKRVQANTIGGGMATHIQPMATTSSSDDPTIQGVDGIVSSVSIAGSGGSTTHTQALQDVGSDTSILNHGKREELVGKGDCVGEV